MPQFYSPPFTEMCNSIYEIAKEFSSEDEKKNVLRQKRIAEMVAVAKHAESELLKHKGSADYVEREKKAHQQVENILTYVLEEIRQEREKLKVKLKDDALYCKIEQALGIDEISHKANTCHVFIQNHIPTKDEIQKIPSKSFVFYKIRFELEPEDTKDFVVVKPVIWGAFYYDETKRQSVVPIVLINDLKATLNKMNNKKVITEKDIQAVKNLIQVYHETTNANELSDQIIFVNLLRLRQDIESERWVSKEFKKIDFLSKIEELMKKIYKVRLKDFNAEIMRRRPTYAALFKGLKAVADAKDTTSWFSGNQAQLLAFLKIANLRINRDFTPLEDNRVAANPIKEPVGYTIRYGILLYCLTVYESYWLKWDFFEKSKQTIPSIENISPQDQNFYLSAADNYISGILTDKEGIKDFEGDNGLQDAKTFLTEVQKNILAKRTKLNEASSYGLTSTTAYKFLEKTAGWASDAAIYAGVFEILSVAAANPTILIAQPQWGALLGAALLLNYSRKPIAHAATSYLAPVISNQLMRCIIAIYPGAKKIFNSSSQMTEVDEIYLNACFRAPHNVVPPETQRLLGNLAVYPDTIPMVLAPAPSPADVKAMMGAANDRSAAGPLKSSWFSLK